MTLYVRSVECDVKQGSIRTRNGWPVHQRAKKATTRWSCEKQNKKTTVFLFFSEHAVDGFVEQAVSLQMARYSLTSVRTLFRFSTHQYMCTLEEEEEKKTEPNEKKKRWTGRAQRCWQTKEETKRQRGGAAASVT